MVTKNDASSINMVREVVVRYFPALWPAVEAGLSTAATLLLKDNSNPVALILVGPSGAGKTTVASMFDDSELKDNAISYRTDKFTAAAWVSQSARQTDDELKKVDVVSQSKAFALEAVCLPKFLKDSHCLLSDRHDCSVSRTRAFVIFAPRCAPRL